MKDLIVNRVSKVAVAAACFAVPFMAKADATDIAGVITDLGTYKTSAIAIGIAVFLFVLGRRVVRKLV